MSYTHIENLYKDQRILEFRWVYALEKIDGAQAHVAWTEKQLETLHFSAQGVRNSGDFVSLFDPGLLALVQGLRATAVRVQGEVYGGKIQSKGHIYGDRLRFAVFDVQINGLWLSVPQASEVVADLGLEFVHYEKVSTDLAALDGARDAESVQAIRNGRGSGKPREGVVLRPPFEVTCNDGRRLLAKHKREHETKLPRVVGAPLVRVSDAVQVAEDWVTPTRLGHVLQRLPHATSIQHTKEVVDAMIEDVLREGADEIEDSPAVRRAIGKVAGVLWTSRFKSAWTQKGKS